MPYQWRVLPFGLVTVLGVFTALTEPILFLCHCKGFHIVIYLDDILVLVCSKWAGKRAHLFLCSSLVCLRLYINFSKSALHFTHMFCFLGLCCDTVHISLSFIILISWLTFSSWLFPCCRPNLLQSIRSCPFLARPIFVPIATPNCGDCVMSFSDMLTVYHSPSPLFSPVYFSFSALHQLDHYLICNRVQFPCNFHFLMWLLLQMPGTLIGPFIFRGLVCHNQLVEPGLVLCVGLLLPCRSFRQLP